MIALAVKQLELSTTRAELVKNILDMLSMLMRGCGDKAKQIFEELSGQELMEQLEYSTNQRVRMRSTEFFNEFFGGSNESDVLFQQSYHQVQQLPAKTDEERYFNDEAYFYE